MGFGFGGVISVINERGVLYMHCLREALKKQTKTKQKKKRTRTKGEDNGEHLQSFLLSLAFLSPKKSKLNNLIHLLFM